MIRLSQLRNAKVKTLDGEALGRVHEVHTEGGKIVALTCGPGSFLESLTARKKGRRIPWECVRRIEEKQIVVTPDPPQRISGPRTRQGTRRPSAPPSRR